MASPKSKKEEPLCEEGKEENHQHDQQQLDQQHAQLQLDEREGEERLKERLCSPQVERFLLYSYFIIGTFFCTIFNLKAAFPHWEIVPSFAEGDLINYYYIILCVLFFWGIILFSIILLKYYLERDSLTELQIKILPTHLLNLSLTLLIGFLLSSVVELCRVDKEQCQSTFFKCFSNWLFHICLNIFVVLQWAWICVLNRYKMPTGKWFRQIPCSLFIRYSKVHTVVSNIAMYVDFSLQETVHNLYEAKHNSSTASEYEGSFDSLSKADESKSWIKIFEMPLFAISVECIVILTVFAYTIYAFHQNEHRSEIANGNNSEQQAERRYNVIEQNKILKWILICLLISALLTFCCLYWIYFVDYWFLTLEKTSDITQSFKKYRSIMLEFLLATGFVLGCGLWLQKPKDNPMEEHAKIDISILKHSGAAVMIIQIFIFLPPLLGKFDINDLDEHTQQITPYKELAAFVAVATFVDIVLQVLYLSRALGSKRNKSNRHLHNVIIFWLFAFNTSFWISNLLVRKFSSNLFFYTSSFWGPVLWTVENEILQPIAILFRFHSLVLCLSLLWEERMCCTSFRALIHALSACRSCIQKRLF